MSDLIGFAVADSPLDPAACHPISESLGVVVAAKASLRNGLASELAPPNHQGLVEQPRCSRSVSKPAIGLSISGQCICRLFSTFEWASQFSSLCPPP